MILFSRGNLITTTSFRPPRPKGFSLIAVAIGIAVVGLLLAAYLRVWRVEIERHKMDVTRAHMRVIHVALTRYMALHAKLPCPENPVLPGARKDGDDSDICARHDTEERAEDPRLWTGVAPLHALHLNDENALDGWGNKFTYTVTSGLTSGKPLGGMRPKRGVLRVVDAEGRNVLATLDGGGRYVLMSHGPSGAGAWTSQGIHRPCSKDTLDSQNCDGDNTFVQTAFSMAQGASFYDDVLTSDDFKDRSTIEQLAWCNMRQAFYAPGNQAADGDGCIIRKGIWTGACTLSMADQSTGLATPPVPTALLPPASKNVARNFQSMADHGKLPPQPETGDCACGADFIKFNAGEWDDHHASPAYAPTGRLDTGPPVECYVPVPAGNKMFGGLGGIEAAAPVSWCLKSHWIRTALFSCTPK
ncbi:MAG: type II secretion system protein [Alphaproteobacteria bacterium]